MQRIGKMLAVLLALLMLFASAQTAFAASYFKTEASGWHYRYYYSGVIELC